jgi:UDP-N-acetylglucosamine--N-acetylmuramyl-(pentapeptide) pyrophosphoryl-undecaprenol N-acetylglucosamine transferase
MEQNVYPGLVTRRFAGVAQRIFTAFEGSREWLKGAGVSVTGNPVRKGFNAGSDRDFFAEKKVLLVMGGSQGARSINRSVISALPALKKLGIEIYHHTGPHDHEEVKEAYVQHLPGGVVREFFDDIDSVMGKAHLALCRAGASTCAELAVAGLPSILVPYPGAGGHQKHNAKEMSDNGAATTIDDGELSGETLAETVRSLLGDPEKLELMSANCRESARPDATERIASEIEKTMEGKWV